jgi:predicted nucleic acid-binding protein
MKKVRKPAVFFNASVILAALKNPQGGSGKLFFFIREKKIKGIITEIILKEVIRTCGKINKSEEEIRVLLQGIFPYIKPPPKKTSVEKYQSIVIDYGDAHVLASGIENKCRYLATLDKKHLLVLEGKIKMIQILSPKQLIELLS